MLKVNTINGTLFFSSEVKKKEVPVLKYTREFEKLADGVIDYFSRNHGELSAKSKEVILKAIQESYDTGYEHGLMDGKEISDKPLSG